MLKEHTRYPKFKSKFFKNSYNNSATISRESNGKYYVSVLYEIIDKIKTRKVISIDLDIKKLLTLLDGNSIELKNNGQKTLYLKLNYAQPLIY